MKDENDPKTEEENDPKTEESEPKNEKDELKSENSSKNDLRLKDIKSDEDTSNRVTSQIKRIELP
jgi:hypothetical protein